MIQLRVNATKLLAASSQTPHKCRNFLKNPNQISHDSSFPPIRLIQYKYSRIILASLHTQQPQQNNRHLFSKSSEHNNMFMSMFSHFEIAEGHNWRFALGLGPVKGPNSDATSSSADSKTAGKDPNQSSTDGSKQNPARLRPRFAPEFDGLHCFESIVPC
uniref:Uncharacterized protein n=1 Tax=Phaseolus vulgaris TaxID=3885 RepID=V7ASY3_PHAVU|nr:hypothetical protein PHAVU_009G045600g [Phaseolus vulgaris]ESW08435.1 hypothetical protein PHAVU_009G045600g [Phaseolus vulgaris]